MALTVERVPVAGLRPAEFNPRRIGVERFAALKRSLAADPEMLEARPVIARPDGTVVCGNMRLRAAVELGWESVPAVVADLDEERARLWMLRDNQEYGEWDEDALAELLYELEQSAAELELTGFPEAELERLLDSVRGPQREVDEVEVPKLPEEPVSRPGELYELGPHRLLCADATKPAALAELMGGASASVLWTDPPYGVDYVGKTEEALRLSNDDAEGLPALLRSAFATVDPVLEPAARFYVAAPAGPRGTDFRLAISEVGWVFHQALVWVKDVFVLGHSDYHYAHEDVLYGWKPGKGRAGRGNHTGSRWYGDHAQSSVFAVDRPKRSAEHPTMKPVELVREQLANSSTQGDVVLDPFAGAGATLLACEQLGRRAFLVEIDARYCDVIRKRYEEYVGGQARAAAEAA